MFDEAGEDELLLAAMARLGATGGALGGALRAPGGGKAGARGGARGAARGFKWTKKDVAEQHVRLNVGLSEAAGLVHRSLAAVGRLVGSEEQADNAVAFRAVLGVGLAGLNPAVVTAVVRGEQAEGVTVSLRAVGREGLIKQHPADKALAKITPLLSAAAA
jgi:hypothetical protein